MIGLAANQFDELDQSEVIEFRKESIDLCKRAIEKRESTLEDHASYAFGAEVLENPKKHNHKFQGEVVLLQIWTPHSSNTPINLTAAVEFYATTIIQEAIEIMYPRQNKNDSDIPSAENYVLKICGRQEYLLGNVPICRYKVSLIEHGRYKL
jgi:hypothetical protein